MNQIIILSESKSKDILLQIIKTLSVLIININNKIILYYLLSNNFINKIINTINNDFIKYDEDFISYYINFLKSISLKIDLTTLPFFFLSQINSFPLLEITLSLYNHQDKMVQSVVKNILLIMLKLNYPPLIEYLCCLPCLAYFSFISCRIKDLLILISNEKNFEQYRSLQEEIVDEIIFIQDIFCLKIDKINHILINSLFSYCILPYIINIKYAKIKLSIKIYFINVLFHFIQEENFLNILFTIIFFPSHIIEINNFIVNPCKEPDNYSFNWKAENNNIQLSSQSVLNYIKYNFNKKTLKYIISIKENKFSLFSKIIEKYKNNSIDENNNTYKEAIKEILNSFSSEDNQKIFNYNKELSMGTGINCCINYEEKEDIFDKCFTNIVKKFYVIYFDKTLELSKKLIDNNIGNYIFSLININQRNENILFLICLLFKNLLVKNNDIIAKILLKEVKLINGNNLNEEEINDIIKINNNKDILNNIIINEQFHEVEEDDEEEEFDKKDKEKNKNSFNQNEIKIKNSILINQEQNLTNKYLCFDKIFFDNIENITNKNKNKYIKNNDINNCYYYNNHLIDLFLDVLNINNNLKPVIFKLIIDNILFLISKKKDNKVIFFCSSIIKSKIENIYKDFKNDIIKNYKNNQNFHLYAYSRFNNQYNQFLSLINYDYNNIIKEGYIILRKTLLNYNSEKFKDIENLFFDKNYNNEEEKKKELLNNNIINFYIIHDFYYIISNENDNNIGKYLFINNYPLKFDELTINKQYFLCDLNSDITYFPCKCKINNNLNNSNNYFESTLLIYENLLYIGNSSSNPNYTRIIDKYSLSNCTIENNNSSPNSIDLYIIDDNNNYIEIEIIVSEYELVNKIIKVVNDKIKFSRQREKAKFKEFLYKLK